MRKLWSLLAAILPFLGGCQRSPMNTGSPSGRLAVAVPTDDALTEAATGEAIDSLDRFIAALAHPSPGQSDFSVKVPLRDGGTLNLLWLQHVTCDGPTFTGLLGPDAAEIPGHSRGERVTIGAREIADWMFVENGRLVGGFTLRAIRERLSGDDRARFEKSMWFKFD
jgi:uncharacterized protein YegJ (DUF2314 family)